jgi:mono/diheme cytochrome c family protein/rhodanese-related sulfurtransferase
MSALLLVTLLALILGCERIVDPVAQTPVLEPEKYLNSPPGPDGKPTQLAEGAALYTKYCALCHGKNAEGYAADNAPSLVSPTFRASVSQEFLREAIAKGRSGTAMAGYGAEVGGPLTEPELTALLAFLSSGNPSRVTLPFDSLIGDLDRGEKLFKTNCMSCHGSKDQRSVALHLFNPSFLSSASPAYMKYAIQEGRPGTAMHAWKGVLADSEIDDLVSYLHSQAPASNNKPVKSVRTPPNRPPVPEWGPIVINPEGGTPSFNLRDGRFAPMADVKRALDEKKRIIIVDARAPSEWLNLHIPGSLPLPYYDLTLLDKLPDDGTWIIAYCACPHHASGAVVDALRQRGIMTSAVLDEGVFAWQREGYPVVAAAGHENNPAPPPLSAKPLKPEAMVPVPANPGHEHP